MNARSLVLAAALVGAAFWAGQASAAPVLGVQLQESGFATFSTSGAADPLVVSQSYGTFSTNVEVNNVVTSPLSIDLGSTNVSTTSAGTLVITASVSGLTSPIGVLDFLSQFSGNFSGAVTSVSLRTFVDDTNTLFGMGTPLASLTDSSSPFALSSANLGLSVNPFALTEVLTITTAGAAVLSLDGSISVPEPTTLALFGAALIGLGLFGWRRNRA